MYHALNSEFTIRKSEKIFKCYHYFHYKAEIANQHFYFIG